MEAPSHTTRRILYVITKASWGGAQRYVFDMACAMHARGMHVTLGYGEDGPLREKVEAHGIATRQIPSLSRNVRLREEWNAFKELVALVKEERPDILHVNSSKAGLALLAGRIARVPRVIFTAHGFAFNEARPLLQRMVIRGVYAITSLLAHEVICVSRAVCRDLSFVPFIRTRVIHNGTSAPEFLARNEARHALIANAPDGIWIGMLSELHPTKRVEDALAAVKELKDLFPSLRLVVMGDGELKEWLTSVIAHYGLEGSVTLSGFVADAPRYLKAFDVFVHASRSEALAYALLEAGHAALPVAATRVGGIPEVVRHKETGLLVPRENPHALARALRTLLEHPEEARAYGVALQERVVTHFSLDQMIRETVRVYENTP